MLLVQFSADGSTLVCRLSGELTSKPVPAYSRQLDSILRTHRDGTWTVVCLDLNMCPMIDAAGIRALVRIADQMSGEERRVRVQISSETMQRTLAAVGLDKRVELVMRRRRARNPAIAGSGTT